MAILGTISKCGLCKELIVEIFDMHNVGRWDFHYDCYRIVLKRLKPLENILLAPQDEFDEYLNEILHVMFRKQADALVGIVKE